MTKIYACLLGDWVCLNDDPSCTISDYHKTPFCWWEEGAPIISPIVKSESVEHSFYGLDYVHVYYQKKRYRIHPSFIQIVDE